MKAVILAAGEGKRLRPFTETMPKVMLPVANKPVLHHILEAVKQTPIQEVILVVGYKKEVIMEYFKDYKNLKITYVEQDKQLGTAHALLQAKKHIKQPFIVLAGDNIIDQKSINNLIKEKSDYAILIKEHLQPSKYGVAIIEKNQLKEIIEKPEQKLGKYISTGIYKLPKTIFNTIQQTTEQGDYKLTTTIQTLIDQGTKITTIKADTWMDIVYPWDLIHVNEIMIQQTKTQTSGTIEKGVTIKGSVHIGKDTKIYSGCYIVGPTIIGEGCEIGPNTCIFPSTTIGDNTVIQPFTEIKNSIIMKDNHIGSNSYLSHSIIGRGTILRNNFSSVSGKTKIQIENELKKLDHIGSMIGEDCTIGSNTVIEPGIIIGRKCKINPLNRIQNNIQSDTRVM